MKNQACLLGILFLVGVESQLNSPLFAYTMGDSANPQITIQRPIEEFVRSLHPHGVSMASALQYKLEDPSSQQKNVRKLLDLLQKEEEKTHWTTIVFTLSIIADPSVVPEVIKFIEKLEKKPKIDQFDYRALSSSVWGLGILIHLGKDIGSARDDLEKASDFLIKKSQGQPETTSDQQHGFPSPAHNMENGNRNDELFQKSAILGLAFASTDETKEVIRKIYEEEDDSRMKSFLEQVIQAGKKIQEVGLFCYREPQHPRCQENQMGLTFPNKVDAAQVPTGERWAHVPK